MGNTNSQVKLFVQRKKDMKLFELPLVDNKGKDKCNAYNVGLINGKNKEFRCVWVPKQGSKYESVYCLSLPELDKIDGTAKVNNSYISQNSFLLDLESETLSQDVKDTKVQVYPNPANSQASIFYQLDKNTELEVTLINSQGETVLNVFNGNLNTGRYQFQVSTETLPRKY